MSILDTIGFTPLVELSRVRPAGSARVVAKVEWANPTGSMKDRMALAAIEAAERDGRLVPGGTVVEYTGGTTGVSLALVCAAKGYPIKIVFSDAFSEEKGLMMEALGAEIRALGARVEASAGQLARLRVRHSRIRRLLDAWDDWIGLQEARGRLDSIEERIEDFPENGLADLEALPRIMDGY